MPGLRLKWKAEAVAADTHLALLGIKIWEPAFWELCTKSLVLTNSHFNGKVQEIEIT